MHIVPSSRNIFPGDCCDAPPAGTTTAAIHWDITWFYLTHGDIVSPASFLCPTGVVHSWVTRNRVLESVSSWIAFFLAFLTLGVRTGCCVVTYSAPDLES